MDGINTANGNSQVIYPMKSLNQMHSKRESVHPSALAKNIILRGTVEKYGAYSKAVDQIAKKDPSMLPRILSGRYKISHENVLALSRMSQQEVKRFGRQMKAMRQSSTVVPYGVSRSQLGQITPKPQITLQPGIKNMPDFDPDAAIAGLTLTIPSWTSSIKRALNSSNMNTVSIKARTNLQQALRNLQATIDELLRAIKE